MEFNKRMAKLYEANYFTPQLPMRKYSNPYYLPSSQTLLSQILATGGMTSSGSSVASASVGPSLPPSAPKPAFDPTPKKNPEDLDPTKPKPRPVKKDPARQAKRVIGSKIGQLRKDKASTRDAKKLKETDKKIAKLKDTLAKTGKVKPIIKDKTATPKPTPAPTKKPTSAPVKKPTSAPVKKPATPEKKTVSKAKLPFLDAVLEGELNRDDIAVAKGKGRGGFQLYRGLTPTQSKEYGEAIATRAAKFKSFNEFKLTAATQSKVAMSRTERQKLEDGGSKTLSNLMTEFEKANATIDRLNGLNTDDDPFGRKQGTKTSITDASTKPAASGQGSLTKAQIASRNSNLADLSIARDNVRTTGRAESAAQAIKKGTRGRAAKLARAQKASRDAIASQTALEKIEKTFADASKKKRNVRGGN